MALDVSLYFDQVSVDKRLIPLSVLTDGHLLHSLFDPSGTDLEWRIDDCVPVLYETLLQYYSESIDKSFLT